MKRSVLVLSIIIASSIGLGVYTAASIVLPRHFVPAQFVEARRQGADIAEDIVALSDASLSNLEQIAYHDTRGERSQALTLISSELTRMEDMRNQALELSKRLEQMALAIESIRPTHARIVAAEAVSSEVALVSRLLSYNDLLFELFTTLQRKMLDPTTVANNEVQKIIDEINVQVRGINAADKRFNESLAALDALLEE